MKMLRDTSRSAAFPSLLCIFCFLLLVATAGGQTCGQSLALTESTKAFYRGDYSRAAELAEKHLRADRKSTRLNSSHGYISYAVFCLKKKKKTTVRSTIRQINIIGRSGGRPYRRRRNATQNCAKMSAGIKTITCIGRNNMKNDAVQFS